MRSDTCARAPQTKHTTACGARRPLANRVRALTDVMPRACQSVPLVASRRPSSDTQSACTVDEMSLQYSREPTCLSKARHVCPHSLCVLLWHPWAVRRCHHELRYDHVLPGLKLEAASSFASPSLHPRHLGSPAVRLRYLEPRPGRRQGDGTTVTASLTLPHPVPADCNLFQSTRQLLRLVECSAAVPQRAALQPCFTCFGPEACIQRRFLAHDLVEGRPA